MHAHIIKLSSELKSYLHFSMLTLFTYTPETGNIPYPQFLSAQLILHKLQTSTNSCPNNILYIHWPEKISKEDLWKTVNQKTEHSQTLTGKWGWIHHTLKKPVSNITMQALIWNPQRKRKKGRPRNTWHRNTKAEMQRSNLSWKELETTAQCVVDGLYSSWSKRPSYVSRSFFNVLLVDKKII